MAKLPIGDTPGCPPGTFSLFPPFILTVIKQRLSPSRYTIIRADRSPPPVPVPVQVPDTGPGPVSRMPFNPSTGESTPRPSSAGSTSTARNSDDSGSFGNDEDVFAVGVQANHEVDSGLRWNRVNPALNLLRHAGYEAQQPNCESRLVRSLFLDSLAYLLSALPEDLTSEEASTLRGSLPESLKQSLAPSLESGISASHQITDSESTAPGQRSYLHRLLAATIIYFCILLQFLMPYIKDVLYHLYRYDRAHRVTERVTGLTLYVAEKVGRGGVNLGNVVLSMYDGRPGSAVSGAAGWWLEGVAGGIYEGLGEGMAILGVVGVESAGDKRTV
ncbi:hypothetical protein BDV18DRAFT_156986 [Aspergillus unguis]